MPIADRILNAATRLFAANGYKGTSLQAISDEVGVTKQTLLYHYSSKEALREAVLEDLFTHWRIRLPQMLDAITQSGLTRYEAILEELIFFFQDDSDKATLVVREMLDNPGGIGRLLETNLKPWLLLLTQYIKEGQNMGLIYEDLDPELFILNVIDLAVANAASGAVLASALSGSKVSAKKLRKRQVAELSRLVRTSLFKE